MDVYCIKCVKNELWYRRHQYFINACTSACTVACLHLSMWLWSQGFSIFSLHFYKIRAECFLLTGQRLLRCYRHDHKGSCDTFFVFLERVYYFTFKSTFKVFTTFLKAEHTDYCYFFAILTAAFLLSLARHQSSGTRWQICTFTTRSSGRRPRPGRTQWVSSVHPGSSPSALRWVCVQLLLGGISIMGWMVYHLPL